jgi:hypothetical protein
MMMTLNPLIESCLNSTDDKGRLEFIEGYCGKAEELNHNFYPIPVLKSLFNLAGENAPASIENAKPEDRESFNPNEVKRLISVARTRLGL